MWFLLLRKYYKMVSKLISKLTTKILAINILDSKRLIETNLEHK